MSQDHPPEPAHESDPHGVASRADRWWCEEPVRAIESEFLTVLGRVEKVEAACASLRRATEESGAFLPSPCVLRLASLLAARQGPPAVALFRFLREQVPRCADPAPPVRSLLLARDPGVRLESVKLVLDLLHTDRLTVSMELARALAEALEAGEGIEPGAGPLEAIHGVLGGLPPPMQRVPGKQARAGQASGPGAAAAEGDDGDSVAALWADASPQSLRRLAARLLDRSGEPVPASRAARLLGADAFAFLSPYLSYTRASHLDLLHLSPAPGELSPGFHSLEAAEGVLGRKLLGDLIGRLGWSRVTWGVEAYPVHGVAVEGSWPFIVEPPEADLLLACGGARRVWKRFLVVVHGGSGPDSAAGDEQDASVERFRRYNVAHAEVLADLMEVAPLTAGKVRRILGKMQGIVEDFAALFADATEDAARLPDRFASLRQAVQQAVGGVPDDRALSAEITRLVQMFEDPERLDDVRTVHGLKRYLHQRSLRLAFRLFRSGRATNRFVDLVLTSQHQVLEVVQKIRYIEFEPQPGRDPAKPPFAVALLAEALGRQLAHGQNRFPDIEVLCYGTEVQVFIRFRNHPVFLRVDLSPPLRGGMIDLEYFGVSQYEMEHHPDLALRGIQRLFRRLDFDVGVDGFRLHLRYDKERAHDLGDLLDKLGVLFPLLPYLMDFDWTLGGLDYLGPARDSVADGWAEFLLRWGVLPTDALLTSDRRKVLLRVQPDPAGDREVPWDGRGRYRDRFTGAPPGALWNKLRERLDSWGLGRVARWEEAAGAGPGQISLEKAVLKPLRQAVAREEIRRAPVGHTVSPAELFIRDHAVDRFAELLAEGGPAVKDAARLGRLVGSIERHLRFRVTGSVNGHAVQEAVLPLRGERIALSVLRDPRGMACLALGAPGGALYRRRDGPSAEWERGAGLGWETLTRLLRGNNYLAPDLGPMAAGDEADLEARIAELRAPSPLPVARVLPGERIVPGLAAAPGRAAGFVCFPAEQRSPAPAEILFAPAVRPQDAPLLRQMAGIVSTGGGALSHAGLVALELGKPALIVPGRWERGGDGSVRFVYRRPVFREEEDRVAGLPVMRRLDLREEEETLAGGELVVVDADGACLAVLGGGRDALAVHQELHHLGDVTDRLAVAREGPDTLALRGRLLRTGHQLQKVLARITDPALARHAVRQLLGGEAARYLPARRVRQDLLASLFSNPSCGAVARETAASLAAELAGRREALSRAALDALATSEDVFEILFLRREVLRVARTLAETRSLLGSDPGDAAPAAAAAGTGTGVDRRARERLETLRSRRWDSARALYGDPDRLWLLDHMLERMARIDSILGHPLPEEDLAHAHRMREELSGWRKGAVGRLSSCNVVTAGEGGRELAPLVGSKAANLGEVARVLGAERVPSWFALTDGAFRTALGSGLSERGRETTGNGDHRINLGEAVRINLGEAIEETLARAELDPARKSAVIRDLWQRARLPEALAQEIVAAYRRLGAGPEGAGNGEDPAGPFVSIRSSAFEEDTERGAWAGAFDTFLFVRGEEGLVEFVKLAWAGLWTERAIRMRQAQGSAAQPCGGGLIVQRMVRSRVSGVVHTVSAATRQLRDLVINAGLGLGEGVVSGMVEVDHILVSKVGDPLDDSLRFQYRVGDKREQVVFDTASGQGTRRVETLYHQRLRPALEYVELCELVRSSLALEAVYGHPLDLEFAIQDQELLVLQVRPIPLFHSLIAETLERFPLSVRTGGDREAPR